MKRKQPEFELHCVVADYLRLQYPHLMWLHCPNGEKRNPITGSRLKRMGVRKGVADILLFWCDDEFNFQGAAIELKAGKNGLEPDQKQFRNDWINNAGGYYAICRSLDEVKAHLNAWGVPKWAQKIGHA